MYFYFGVLKPGVWCVIRFKLTPTLAPNVYNDCSIRGGGAFRLLSNILDTKGEVWERVSLVGTFLDFSGEKPRCLVGYAV